MQHLTSLQRLPAYVFGSITQLKNAALARGETVFDFGMGNPDLPPAPHILAALQSAIYQNGAHRYSATQGILPLRQALSQRYEEKYRVSLNPATEIITTIGSKEGIAHLALATVNSADNVLVPDPCYPIHHYAFTIAGANVVSIPMQSDSQAFLQAFKHKLEQHYFKFWVLNFPCNPTTDCVELDFFEEIISLAKHYGSYVIHDLAYGDLGFDGYQAPSILQVPGAKEVAVEFFTLSKSYCMAGWRIGFMCGNAELVAALGKLKTYLDYGMFAPLQIAAAAALTGPQEVVSQIRDIYQQRRDVFCNGLNQLGWPVTKPRASMFVWAKLPPQHLAQGSMAFAETLLTKSNVVVFPGIGFGRHGDQHVRFSMVEPEPRIHQALTAIAQNLALT